MRGLAARPSQNYIGTMSFRPDTATEERAPPWLLALLGAGAAAMLLGAGLAWYARGSAIVLDMASFFCL